MNGDHIRIRMIIETRMNEWGPHSNKSDHRDRIVQNILKEFEVITYTNMLHLLFQHLDHKNSKVKHVLFVTLVLVCENNNLRS